MGIQFTIQGGQFSIRGFNIPWMKKDPGVNLPWGSKYHMIPVKIVIPECKNGYISGKGEGGKNSRGGGVDIPWVRGSISHG
jgi:hypothetical protein